MFCSYIINNIHFTSEKHPVVAEVAHWVKVLTVKSDNLNLIHETHMVKRENPAFCPLARTGTLCHTQMQINSTNFKCLEKHPG